MSSMHSNCFALVDCNNFYVSCERLFNPKLINKPVIILSSNDGCVIARSNEAKLLGIQMSQPYFQIDKLCKQNNVFVFSSNFALYGDISHRVMITLRQLCPDMEIYSVDEAFLRLDRIGFSDPFEYAQKIRNTVFQNIGIPVSIGIAPTKTLAKMASHLAKQKHALSDNYICDCRHEFTRTAILTEFPVGNIWGVGRKTAQLLSYQRINTASQLCAQDTAFLKKRFSIMITRVVLELQGTSCLTLDEIKQKQNITCSRSFGKPILELAGLLEALSTYAARACEKARNNNVKSRSLCIYVQTNRFNQEHYYSASDTQLLLHPSNDTCYITTIAQAMVKKLFKSGFSYRKAGVILCDLLPEAALQEDLFIEQHDDNKIIMRTIDSINKRYGSHSVFLAAEGINPSWMVKSTKKSASYTTNWGELKKVF